MVIDIGTGGIPTKDIYYEDALNTEDMELRGLHIVDKDNA